MTVSITVRHKSAPRDHLLFSDHMTAADFDHPIRETFLGQAHIAGTGPEGKTCRECRFWGRKATRKTPDGKTQEYLKQPGYYGKRHQDLALEAKKASCTKPVLNKAKRLIPHSAKSCRLFEPATNPLPASSPE